MSALGPDQSTIRATWRWLAHGAHGVSEVRVIRPAGGIIGIGFFDDEEAFVRECVRTNAAGNVYVVDKAGRLQKFDPEGSLLAVVQTPAYALGKPTGLSWTPGGELLAADTHYARVLIYDADLELQRAFGVPGWDPGQFLFVTYAFESADGEIYTTDYGDDYWSDRSYRAMDPEGHQWWFMQRMRTGGKPVA